MAAPAVPLDPALPAGAAIARILLAHLAVMDQHEAGVLRNTDPEDLHDFRVAIRSSRSILSQTRGAFPVRPTLRFCSHLAWLAAATSAARDFDVFLEKLPEYQEALATVGPKALEPLRDFLEARRQQAHARLARTLTGKRYRAFKVAYDGFLRARAETDRHPRNGEGPALELAARAARRRYRKLRKEGRAAGDAAPTESLHELRKTGKKLRYLVEAFRALCAEEESRAVVKALKTVQNLLGGVVDLAVQRRLLRQWAREIGRSGMDLSETFMAMQFLDLRLAQAELETRGAFHGHLGTLGDGEMRARMKRLFSERRA